MLDVGEVGEVGAWLATVVEVLGVRLAVVSLFVGIVAIAGVGRVKSSILV